MGGTIALALAAERAAPGRRLALIAPAGIFASRRPIVCPAARPLGRPRLPAASPCSPATRARRPASASGRSAATSSPPTSSRPCARPAPTLIVWGADDRLLAADARGRLQRGDARLAPRRARRLRPCPDAGGTGRAERGVTRIPGGSSERAHLGPEDGCGGRRGPLQARPRADPEEPGARSPPPSPAGRVDRLRRAPRATAP